MAAGQARGLARPDDVLLVDEEVYSWRHHDEYAVSAYWTGDYAACAEVCRELLAGGSLPESQLDRVQANLRHAEAGLRIIGADVPDCDLTPEQTAPPVRQETPAPVTARLPRPRAASAVPGLQEMWQASWSGGESGASVEPARIVVTPARIARAAEK
jgi:hypothetical protein